MQKTDARVTSCDEPTGSKLPAAAPCSSMRRQSSSPKQPADTWLGQKRPSPAVSDAVPVVSGDKFTGIEPTRSEQMPPPQSPLVWQTLLFFEPPKHRLVP
jgi:hypothetical protein